MPKSKPNYKNKPAPKSKSVEHIYLGRCLNDFGIVRHKFRDAKNKLAFFEGRINAQIGSCYPITDGFVLKNPVPVDKPTISITAEELRESSANEQAVRYTIEKKKKMSKLRSPHPDLVRAISLLTPFFYDLNFIASKRLMDFIYNEVTNEVNRRNKKLRKTKR